MLKRLRLHNFKSFLNFEMDFTRRHLLIGKNNSGKSNLCAAMRFLGATSRLDLGSAAANAIPGGIPEIKNWSYASDTIDFGLECELPFANSRLAFRYDLSLEVVPLVRALAAGEIGLRVAREQLVLDGDGFTEACLLQSDGREARLMHEERSEEPNGPKTLAPKEATMLSQLYESGTNRRAILFRKFLQSWFYFHLSAEAIRLGWREADRTGSIYYQDGRHLPNAIFRMKNEDDRRYRRLIERVRTHFEPDLEAVNFLVSPDQGVVPFVTLRGRPKASWAVLSDGTLLALGISQLIEQADALSDGDVGASLLMLIEEPETGLYVPTLKALMEDFEARALSAQVVFTSHSPYFIDLFDRDLESITALKKEGGVTRPRPLLESKERIREYRDDFSLGELHFKEFFA